MNQTNQAKTILQNLTKMSFWHLVKDENGSRQNETADIYIYILVKMNQTNQAKTILQNLNENESYLLPYSVLYEEVFLSGIV